MIFENKIEMEIIDNATPAQEGPRGLRMALNDTFMRNNGITRESHEKRDMGLVYDGPKQGFYVTGFYVTRWVPND